MKLKRIILFLILYIFIIYILVAGIPGLIVNIQLSKYRNIVSGTMVDVYFHMQDTTKKMDIEQYVLGVLTAEMPVSFEIEALKAQAVAARTFAYSRMLGLYTSASEHEAPVCTDHTCCQSYMDFSETIELWSSKWRAAYEYKIRAAVYETIGMVIFYDDEPIDPLYHSNGGGRTENNEDVWGGTALPYLRSTTSYGDDESPYFSETINVSNEEFIETLTEKYAYIDFDSDKSLSEQIDIISYTEGGSIDIIKIGDIKISGVELKNLFSLKSCKISFKYSSDNIFITVIGSGHGVGMSQWGANYLAEQEYDYEGILKYYYNGIELKKMW